MDKVEELYSQGKKLMEAAFKSYASRDIDKAEQYRDKANAIYEQADKLYRLEHTDRDKLYGKNRNFGVCYRIFENNIVNNTVNNNLDDFTISNYRFTIPVDLTVVKSYNNSKEYEYRPNAYNDSLCKIHIKAEPSSSTARNYILYNQNKYTEYNKSEINYKETYVHQWFYQTYYTPGSQDYIKEYAMKDYSTNEIYSITTLSYSTNECENVVDAIIRNFKKKN